MEGFRGLEFDAYPTTNHYRCQENAWMDERVMLAWVDEVLVPYVTTAPDNIVPLLILDSYRCHMMGSVVQRIQELGGEGAAHPWRLHLSLSAR